MLGLWRRERGDKLLGHEDGILRLKRSKVLLYREPQHAFIRHYVGSTTRTAHVPVRLAQALPHQGAAGGPALQ